MSIKGAEKPESFSKMFKQIELDLIKDYSIDTYKSNNRINKKDFIIIKNHFKYINIIIINFLIIFNLTQISSSNKRSLIQFKYSISLKINGKRNNDKLFNEFMSKYKPSIVSINGKECQGFPYQCKYEQIINSIIFIWNDELYMDCCNSMFNGFTEITEIDLSNFYVFQRIDMSNMFYGCSSLISLNLTNFEASVSNMNSIFYSCSSLISLNLSGINTKNVSDMSNMFYDCSSLISLNLSSFDTSYVLDMKYMFYNCLSLTSLNLSNFVFKDVEMSNIFNGCSNLEYINLIKISEKKLEDFIFEGVPENIVICLNENLIGEKLNIIKDSSCKKLDCSLNWKLNRKKLVKDGDQCLDNCNNSQFSIYEYNGKCYEQCSYGTMTLNGIQYCKCKSEKCLFCPTISSLSRDLCIKCNEGYYPMENDPFNIGDYINCYKDLYGYYLDKKDLLYKKCFDSCDSCEINGDKNTHNCLKCNQHFRYEIYFNNYYNCYDKPYFYDSNGEAHEIINNENKIYKMVSSSSDSRIIYECSLDDDLNDNCNFLDNLNNNDISNIIEDNINSIYSSNKGKSQVIQGEDNVIYQITSSANELKLLEGEFENNQNISIIDLGQCEKKLKEYYGLNESDSLIYLKQENKSSKSTDKKFQYEVFEPYNFTKLNLSICEGDTINLYIKIDLSEETKEIYESMKSMGYDMFNIKDPFYHDICIPYTYKNNIDILLSDRIDYIYNNKDSQCQSNCQFSSYLKNSLYINCTCAATDDIEDNIEHFNGKKLYESFYDVLKYSNFHVLKCYKLVFVKNVIIKNLGSIIILIVVFLYIFCLIFFIIKGILPLINKIKSIKEKSNEKFERNNELSIHKIQKDNKENNPSQIINNNNEKILMNPNKKKIRISIDNSDTKNNLNNKKFETRKKRVKSKTAKLSKVNNLLIKNLSSSQNVITNSKKNQDIIKVDSFINKDDKKIENLDPYELNDLE